LGVKSGEDFFVNAIVVFQLGCRLYRVICHKAMETWRCYFFTPNTFSGLIRKFFQAIHILQLYSP